MKKKLLGNLSPEGYMRGM